MDLLARQRKSWCVSCSITEKSSWILREITSNFKERAKFRTRKKTIVSLKFSGIMNAISEQKISHVTDVYVTADLYQARPDKPKIIWRYKITCFWLFTSTLAVCLHLEQAFETLLEEMKLDTDVLEETFPSYNLNFYFYFYFYTYTWQRLPIAPR